MKSPRIIPLPIPCAACGYELKGLPSDHNCPECGKPISETFAVAMTGAMPSYHARVWRIYREWLRQAAKNTPYPSDSYLFVHEAVRFARREKRVPASAAKLGSIIVEYALHRFAGSIPDARAELLDLNLMSGKDLRYVVELLIEFNLLHAEPGDDLNILENSFSLDSALPPVEIPPPPPFLPFDLACCSCLYNLRGLPWTADCPECSTPLWQTLHRLADGRIPAPQQMTWQALRTWHKHIAHTAGHRVDALLFVHDALLTWCTGTDDFSAPPMDLPPAMLCEAVRRYARSYFNDPPEAAQVLHDWNLRTAQDLLQIAAAIAEHHLLWFRIDPQALIPQFDLAPPAPGL